MMALKQINRGLAKGGYPFVELVRSPDGYHYFTFNFAEIYDSESVMIQYTSHLTDADWIDRGHDFAREVMKRFEHQIADYCARKDEYERQFA